MESTNTKDNMQRMDELIEILNNASDAYYNGQDEIMSNYQWDSLFDELTALEQELGIVKRESPTNSTGHEAANGEKEEHEYQALSLAKTKSVDDLKKWSEGRDINLSYKLDGLTLVLTYDNGELTKILTRGNGTVGTNITYLKDAIMDIPSLIKYKGHLVVRGEAIISYDDFEYINATLEGDESYANPRNLASGTLSLDDPAKVKERLVRFVPFTLVHIDEDIVSWSERMDYLASLGFKIVEYVKTNNQLIERDIDAFTKRVEDGSMNYPVDGLVICYDDTEYAKTGSVTGHHATRAGLAFKWQDIVCESILTDIEWSCAISTISPVAIFEPVQIEGTTVQRASLCNISEMERLGLGGIGTRVQCIKSNKIIPKIIGVSQKVGEYVIPAACPACGRETRIMESVSGTKTLHCTNNICPAKNVMKYTRFVSKQGMDIDGLSLKTLLKFINLGFVKNYSDIYHLDMHKDIIINEDGFGVKSYDNLIEAINRSRDTDPISLLFALCIPQIGVDAGKKIFNFISFKDFCGRLDDNIGFEDIKGIGKERSTSLLDWYNEGDNKSNFIMLLKELNIKDVERINDDEATLNGLTFVVTGDVYEFKNRSELKKYIESKGGSVTGSVSKKTNYLINNDVDSTSSKNNKAKELSIPIISEREFIELFGR